MSLVIVKLFFVPNLGYKSQSLKKEIFQKITGKNMRKTVDLRKSCHNTEKIIGICNEQLQNHCFQQLLTLRLYT